MSGPDEAPAAALSLSAAERTVLELLRGAAGSVPEPDVAARSGLADDVVRGALQRLRSKHLAVSSETYRATGRPTPRGSDAAARGLPERRLLTALASRPEPVEPSELGALGLDDAERSAAIGILRRRGFLQAGRALKVQAGVDLGSEWPEESALRAAGRGDVGSIPDDVLAGLVRRGLLSVDRITDRAWSASDEGRALPIAEADRPLLGELTPELLKNGRWQDGAFRPYDVRAPVPYVTGARPHPYIAFLRTFEETLVGLGFAEASGPIVETEFWNSDVLFMPQEHPARSIHDVLRLENLAGRTPDGDLVGRVAAVHEGRALPGDAAPLSRGWGTTFDPAISARPVLRSQTTAVSARFLAAGPTPPFRMYSLDRNIRKESLDATHHLEFAQCEGVLGQEGITLRHLVGVFQSLAAAIGIKELRLRPSYFPFTEPSIEGYVRHPRLGWIEVFPGGLFRPEVLRPLRIHVPVAAWGIGVTRLAMVALGVSDIRDLYLDDLERLTSGRL